MDTTNNILLEGKFDKGIFKALVVVGGPNIGKTSLSDLLRLKTGVMPRVYDADKVFEYLSDKEQINIKDDKSAESTSLYGRARPINNRQLAFWINEMHPLVVNLAPDNIPRLQHRLDLIESYGYDTKLIIIKPVDVDKTVQTLGLRKRGVDPEWAREALEFTDEVIEHYKNQEKYAILVMPNMQDINPITLDKVIYESRKFYNEPVKNPKGQKYLDALHAQPHTKRISDVEQDAMNRIGAWNKKPYLENQ